MKDEGQGAWLAELCLQIEQGAPVNLATLEGCSGSAVLGLPLALALQTRGLAVLKLPPTGMSPVPVPGKLIWLTLPVEPVASEWLGYRLEQRAEVFSR